MLSMVMLRDCWARAASLVPCLTCSRTGGRFYQVDWCWTILYHSGVPPCVSSPPSPPSTPPSCSSSRWAGLTIGSKLCANISLHDLLNLGISALHDHWHCLPLAPPTHLSAAGEEKHMPSTTSTSLPSTNSSLQWSTKIVTVQHEKWNAHQNTHEKSSSCYPLTNPSYPGSNQPQVCWSHWQLLDAPLLHWQAGRHFGNI